MMPLPAKLACTLAVLVSLADRALADDPATSRKVSDIPGIESLRNALRETVIAAEAVPSIPTRCDVLTRAALDLVRIGDVQEAQKIARKAAELARAQKPVYESQYLIRTAHVHELAGDQESRRRDLEDAVKAASARPSASERLAAWREVVQEVDALGDRAKALEIAEWMVRDLVGIEGRFPRFQALGFVCSTRMEFGDCQGALKIAADFDEGDAKSKLLFVGLIIKEVNEPARGASRPRRKATPEERARRRDFLMGLIETLNGKESYYMSPNSSLAKALAIEGEFESAERIVRKMSDLRSAATDRAVFETSAVPDTMIAIGKARYEAGQKEEGRSQIRRALELVRADQKYSSLNRSVIQTSAARALAEIGEFDEAIKTLELESTNQNRAALLLQIALLQFKRGDVNGARKTNLAALRMAEKFNGENRARGNNDFSFLTFVQIQASLGDYAKSVEASQEIKTPSTKELAQTLIGVIRARNGDVPGAVSWASKLDDLVSRSVALDGIVSGITPSDR